MNKATVKRIALLLATLTWMGVIFFFSAQPKAQSERMSSPFAKKAVKITTGMSPESRQSEVREERISYSRALKVLTVAVRKTAHLFEYAVLGLLTVLLVLSFSQKETGKTAMFQSAGLSSAICIIYSCTDEFHQYFVPGRACRAVDLAVDFCGSTAGILLCLICMKMFIRKGSKIK